MRIPITMTSSLRCLFTEKFPCAVQVKSSAPAMTSLKIAHCIDLWKSLSIFPKKIWFLRRNMFIKVTNSSVITLRDIDIYIHIHVFGCFIMWAIFTNSWMGMHEEAEIVFCVALRRSKEPGKNAFIPSILCFQVWLSRSSSTVLLRELK